MVCLTKNNDFSYFIGGRRLKKNINRKELKLSIIAYLLLFA